MCFIYAGAYIRIYTRAVQEGQIRNEYDVGMRDNYVSMCGDMRYIDLIPGTTVDKVNLWRMESLKSAKEEILRRLARRALLPTDQQGNLEATISEVFDAHSVLQGKSIDSNYRKGLTIVTPIKRELIDRPDKYGKARGPRRGEHVYDVPLTKTLEAMFSDEPGLLIKFQNVAADWAATKPVAGGASFVYHDLTDGEVFRSHSELGPDADRTDGSLRLAFILYYDDVEVVNALGSFTGVHKLGLFYWAFVNHHRSERMALRNIHLATVALEADIAYYGIEQIVCGPPREPEDGSSIGACLRRLDKGHTIKVDQGGAEVPILVRGWLLVASADYPAAGLLSGSMCGATAVRFCRECEIDRHDPDYDVEDPNSFVDPDCPSAYPLRNPRSVETSKRKCGCDTKKMAKDGWTTWKHAFTRIPKFNILLGLPQDLMHVECEGTLKCECAAFLFYCIRIRKFFTLEDLNRKLDSHPFQDSKRPPYFTEGIEKGRANPDTDKEQEDYQRFLPKKGAHVHQTAADMMTFALHSPTIFRDLGVPETDPAFSCWLTHVEYFSMLLQHSMTREEVMTIDALIRRHHKELKELKVYKGIWKPKNHFSAHFALNIMNFGPPRHYWCMRFEAMNQIFKKIAVGGSYRDTTWRCANFWTVRSARIRKSGELERWGETKANNLSLPTLYSRSCGNNAVDWMFQYMYPTADMMSITWIGTLYHEGTTATPGYSWIEISTIGDDDATPALAHVPANDGIFSLNGEIHLFLTYYPPLLKEKGDLFTKFAEGYEPSFSVVPLKACETLRWLWPVKQELEDGFTTFHFVRY